MILELLGLSLLIMIASLSGVLFFWKQANEFLEENLCHFVSLSAGVSLVIVYALTQESIELIGFTSAITWVAVGALSIWALFSALPAIYKRRKKMKKTESAGLDARKIIASDWLHNIGDGIVLAAAFAVSTPLALVTAASIFVHEIVQEISEFFVLKEAGYSTPKALGVNFIVSSSILIGAVGGFFLLEQFETLEAPLLGFAAGAFLLVVFHDLIPYAVRTSKTQNSHLKHILWFVLGIVVMSAITFATPHSHEHAGQDTHAHDEHAHEEEHLHDHE